MTRIEWVDHPLRKNGFTPFHAEPRQFGMASRDHGAGRGAAQSQTRVDLDVVAGSLLSAIGGQLAEARFSPHGVASVNVTLSASPYLGFGISVVGPSGGVPVELIATDLTGCLARNGRVRLKPAAFRLPTMGRATAQVVVDLKHPEDFEDAGPWAAEVLFKGRVAGTTSEEAGTPVILRLPHGSPPDILYAAGPVCWITNGTWKTASELPSQLNSRYYLHCFLPSVSGSDVVISVVPPQGYGLEEREAELWISGNPSSVRFLDSHSCAVRLGPMDTQDVYCLASAENGVSCR